MVAVVVDTTVGSYVGPAYRAPPPALALPTRPVGGARVVGAAGMRSEDAFLPKVGRSYLAVHMACARSSSV